MDAKFWEREGERRLLHSGRFSTVYRTLGTDGATPLAVKVLNPGVSPRAQTRFLRGCEVLRDAGPTNTCLPVVLSADHACGTAYCVMPHYEGARLQSLVDAGSPLLDRRAIVHITAALAEGLEALHRLDCVHLVEPRSDGAWAVVLLGLGLVRQLLDPDTGPTASKSLLVMGTPAYLAPEALRTPAAADGRADVYALGVLLHLLLARRLPFTSASVIEQLLEKERGASVLGEGGRLTTLVAAMLAPSPFDRPGCREVVEELRQVASEAALPGETLAGQLSLAARVEAPSKERR
jgi:serine/threonine-protein kinase